MNVKYRLATKADHEEILRVAKQSVYTKDFSNTVMFSSDAAYEKGWIQIAREVTPTGKELGCVGFTCVREKTRVPEVVLYFIGIDKGVQRQNIGSMLLENAMARSKHKTMSLNVAKDNQQAIDFYTKHGFIIRDDQALNGTGYNLVKGW